MSLAARLLNTIERVGNRLPDPVFLFLWLILGLIGWVAAPHRRRA